ncbi:uncharacterized protein LOC113878313 [Bos indicus x Bos taurus]|uniref:uncharacterized protein LOC113878313 n=1 Tax=Bos indicus x Bos taurus TaxID=30522 RepID=UPI0007603EAC|nr:uncharacterized protein LOC113878313 [Bos indicus x Bos taurus]
MSWGLCQQLWSQEWGGKEVTGRVGVQAVVQKGRRALRKGGIKRNLRIKRREAGSKLGHCWCSWHPAAGPALSRDPSPPPASEEFGVSLSRKDRAASDTQEERPERRNPGAAPEVGEGRLAGSGAWCQEPGWRDMLGSTEGQGPRVEDPHAQAQKRSYIRLWTNEKETAGAPHHCRTPAWTLGRSFPCSWALVSHFLTLSPHIAPASLPTPRFPAPCAKSQPTLVPAPAAGAQAAKRKGCCSSQPRDSPQEEARLLGKSGHFCWTLGRELIFFPLAVCLLILFSCLGLQGT